MSEQQPPDGEQQAQEQPPARPKVPLSQQFLRVLVAILVVLFAIFAIANSQPVDFSWIFGETRVEIDETGARVDGGVPLIALLVGAFLLGLFAGLLLSWQSARARRKEARKR